ncbi:unnamed protein product [Adineta steineri]|uniref:Uncharacterized protein n=1 Tax=Adineta steineri TaxID=433720 RepID=A0A818R8V7_9BILA|nr:unnamed protein product [Adineta steineri]CAF1522079.1 unnamed protein product [Adineta steineri]CAF3646614.1 unnamed protein product [Adineta steineri]CAF4163043.1 unnamed protein product [Adineta steineri]
MSYSLLNSNSNWTSNLFVNGSAGSGGAHVTIDDCNRRWFVISGVGIKIFDKFGINIGTWAVTTGIFDILILPFYVIIVSDNANNSIIRVDPEIFCDDE